MQNHYQPIYKTAQDLEFKFRDLLDKPDHPTARVLRREIKQLIEDIEVDKKPRSVEDRIKTIQHQFEQSQHHNEAIMNVEHSQHLHNRYEDLRNTVRRLPGY